jgi:hypothetical protein
MVDAIIGYGNGGNLTTVYPNLQTIKSTPEANDFLATLGEEYNQQYEKYEKNQMLVPMAFWARALEKVCKLSIIYGISVDVQNPLITLDAVNWASRFVNFITKQTLHLVDSYTYENPFDAKCKKLVRIMAEHGGKYKHNELLRRMHLSLEEFNKLTEYKEEYKQFQAELNNLIKIKEEP